MKKIFILAGEASGDKLASKAINDLKIINSNIEYLSVGGENLKRIGINSIYDLKEITYLGFTSVFLNIFKTTIVRRALPMGVFALNKNKASSSLILVKSKKCRSSSKPCPLGSG